MKRLAAISIGMSLGILGACGTLTSEPENPPTPPPDATDEGADGADAATDAPPTTTCHGAFGGLSLVLARGTDDAGIHEVDSVAITSDELHLYATLFTEDAGKEARQIYAIDRPDRDHVFTLDLTRRLDLGKDGLTPGAFDVSLSPDDTTLYFSHRNDALVSGSLDTDVYRASRGANGAIFDETSLGARINDPSSTQFHAHAGGLNLFFTVAVTGDAGTQGQRDIYIAPLANATPREALSGFGNPNVWEDVPVPSRDELELFYSSDHDLPGGKTKVYLATRAPNALNFDPGLRIAFPNEDITSSYDPQYLSVDGCRLYVLVDRADLYVSTRTP